MEENQNTSSPGLGIDENSKAHLTEAARWAKFLAIVGFVVCGLVVILGIFAGSIFNSMFGRMGEGELSGMDMSGLGAMMSVFYIGFALLYFLPCLFLFRFANQMKMAFENYEQEMLNNSFQNLKKMFRFVGILTIIILCIYALGILMLMVGRSVAGGI
jgi:hypothetical protein